MRTSIFQKLLPEEVDEEERVGVKDDRGDVEAKNPLGDNDQIKELADGVDDAEDDVEHVHGKPGPDQGRLLSDGTHKKNAADYEDQYVEDQLDNLHCQPVLSWGLAGVVQELVESEVEVGELQLLHS